MSEHEANQLTILAIVVTFPIVGLGKLYLSQVMRRNTFIRTSIGDWLVRMFIAIGMTFICIGGVYAVSYAASLGWFDLPLWARWLIRISAVLTALVSFLATVMVVHALIPLLRSPLMFDRFEPEDTP